MLRGIDVTVQRLRIGFLDGEGLCGVVCGSVWWCRVLNQIGLQWGEESWGAWKA